MESLYEYQTPSNNNGKKTQAYYRDHILEDIVKPWMEEGRSFILEEDGDSGHGPRGNNIVKSWKEKNGLRHYFNCPGSPDWPPIEKAWRLPKSEVTSWMCLTHDDLVEAVQDGWHKLDQKTINKWVDQIPDAWRNVRACEYFRKVPLPGGTFELASTSERFLFRQKPVPFPSSGHFPRSSGHPFPSPRVGSSFFAFWLPISDS
jgi:hypothetical protein